MQSSSAKPCPVIAERTGAADRAHIGSGGVLSSCVLVSSVALTSCGDARARSTLAGSGNLERADAALAPVVHGHDLAFKAKSSLDERAGRADEPYSQRGDCSALPLRQPPPASPTHPNIPRRLQLGQASQDFEWAHAFRIRL